MTMTIALAGFLHETNTFDPKPTGLPEFIANGLLRGDELHSLRGTNTVIGGALDEMAELGIDPLPIVSASAIPGGLVTAEAIETIEEEIVAGLSRRPIDAVVLDLHGAMMTQLADDGEGATLRRIRAAVGPDLPIVTVLDLHANITGEMAALSTILLPYDTYPHIDCGDRGREAVRLAARTVRGEIKPTSALVKLPMMPVPPKQFSHVEPTVTIMAGVFARESDPRVVNLGVGFGFPYADAPFTGMSVIATTDDDPTLAAELARAVAGDIWSRREQFRPDALTVEQAVHQAMTEPAGPVVLADLGDNPGGGSACDGTALLWALLDLGARDVAVAVIADPEVVAAAVAAGAGATLEIDLGGKTDDLHGYPITVEATVVSLSDGAFVYEGPVETGRPDTLGRAAVLACHGRHDNTVEVIVCERRVQPLDTAIFRSQGIEPTQRQILVVKSSVHYRGAFMPIASRIIEVDTPGLTSIDLNRFPFQRLPRPIWPLDPI